MPIWVSAKCNRRIGSVIDNHFHNEASVYSRANVQKTPAQKGECTEREQAVLGYAYDPGNAPRSAPEPSAELSAFRRQQRAPPQTCFRIYLPNVRRVHIRL